MFVCCSVAYVQIFQARSDPPYQIFRVRSENIFVRRLVLKADLSRVQMRGLTSKHKQLALLYALVQAACSVPLPEFTVACCALWNSYACDDNGN